MIVHQIWARCPWQIGLALESHLLAPRSEPAAPVVNFVLRHSGLEQVVGISKDILSFPLSFCPTAAEISLSLEAEGLTLARPKGRRRHLTRTLKKLAWKQSIDLRVFRPARRKRRAP